MKAAGSLCAGLSGGACPTDRFGGTNAEPATFLPTAGLQIVGCLSVIKPDWSGYCAQSIKRGENPGRFFRL
jgi:hypothetical protein